MTSLIAGNYSVLFTRLQASANITLCQMARSRLKDLISFEFLKIDGPYTDTIYLEQFLGCDVLAMS
jgi:hypothetical protein